MKSRPNENYQKLLDSLIEDHKSSGETPSLLLHSCCGPCSGYVLDYLSRHFKITLFYYNPNIFPEEEYKKRLNTQRQLLCALAPARAVDLIEGVYEPERFSLSVKGLEQEPEGGARCAACFRLRLGETARLASERGFEYFSTTLSVSPHKNANVLAEISEDFSAVCGVKALPADFKKRGGYQQSVRLSMEYELYRQDYCGCPFSIK